MRKNITSTEYTQINTDANNFLIQNLALDDIRIIIAVAQPAVTAAHDFILKPKDGISNKDVIGLVWGKSVAAKASLGLVEG